MALVVAGPELAEEAAAAAVAEQGAALVAGPGALAVPVAGGLKPRLGAAARLN